MPGLVPDPWFLLWRRLAFWPFFIVFALTLAFLPVFLGIQLYYTFAR